MDLHIYTSTQLHKYTIEYSKIKMITLRIRSCRTDLENDRIPDRTEMIYGGSGLNSSTTSHTHKNLNKVVQIHQI